MPQQIVKQPDGKYAIWSTVVNDFVLLDATREEIIEHWTEQERQRITKSVRRCCDVLDSGGKPYYQFTLTWEQANQRR